MGRIESFEGNKSLRSLFRPRVLAGIVGAMLVTGGAGVVLAGEGADVYSTIREFARPSVRQVQVVRPPAPTALPPIFQRREPPTRALGFAPLNPPITRLAPLNEFPRSGPARADSSGTPRKVRHQARKNLTDSASGPGRGLASATNYCVRLCDGYAFPVGNAGTGHYAEQEASCRKTCPDAETALFTAPAGAKDLDSLRRGGLNYTALPAAFRFRDKQDNACRCHAPGAATSPDAYLTDASLRPGDLVSSRMGFRYFEGGRAMPYRSRDFADALSRLTSKAERAKVRDMEVASVRGNMSPKAPDHLKARVAYQVAMAEREARREAARVPVTGNLGRGFQELKARESRGTTKLTTVPKRPAFVALN